MDSSTLFLLRREKFSLIGPLKINHLKDELDKLSKKEFVEISGHLGPWVSLQSNEELIKHYPDLIKYLNL